VAHNRLKDPAKALEIAKAKETFQVNRHELAETAASIGYQKLG
jgi:hypothetical protein